MLLTCLSGCAASRITPELAYFPPPPASPHVVHLKSFNRLDELIPRRIGMFEALRGDAVSPYVGTPAGVAYHNGHLYVCDTELNVVHDWDLSTGQARRIGHHGDVVLSKPVAVAVDEQGRLYVADTGRGEVIAYDADGRTIRRFRRPNETAYRPVAVALDPCGKLYVADIARHRIDFFSTENGTWIQSLGGVGTDLGRFYFPMGVAVTPGYAILVSDAMNSRVQVFVAFYTFALGTGRPGNRYGDMGKPRHLAVGPDGVIYVADVEFAHVHLFNERGELLMLLGGPGDRPGATPMPVGVAIAPALPDDVASLVPADFRADYYLFVTNSIGAKRISLYAVGTAR